ncbi:PQQ-binding-like beta-propeller repeat protein [Paeniroseomonas aquatica]|uniref:outer membrane protein assembly factor BamB family protein n=1 Tax=Paeniroseomonas aquatica TaxID=373043 RepID=UPI003605FD58
MRWLRPLGRFKNEEKRRDPINWAAPVLAGGRLLVANSAAQLVEVNPADGEITGRVELPGPVVQQPAVAGGVLYVLTEAAAVAAIQAAA